VVAAACAAGLPGVLVAVGEALVVRPAVVPVPGEEGDLPAFATTMMTTSKAAREETPVSALCRAGQD
jgi:hypothetical protein